MKKFLVTHDAVIGVERSETVSHRAVELTFYTIVEAANTEEATNQVVAYSDPNFKTKIVSVAELADEVSVDTLYELMQHHKCFREQK